MEGNKKKENEKLTKEKIRAILKNLPEIVWTQYKSDYPRKTKKRKLLKIDDDVIAVLKIIEDIIEYENIEWLKKWISELKSDKTDIRLLADIPISRAEYYLLKGKLVDMQAKILECASMKYKICQVESTTTQRLKDLLASATPSQEFPVELFNKAVKELCFHGDGSIEIIFINDKKLKKEKVNGKEICITPKSDSGDNPNN